MKRGMYLPLIIDQNHAIWQSGCKHIGRTMELELDKTDHCPSDSREIRLVFQVA